MNDSKTTTTKPRPATVPSASPSRGSKPPRQWFLIRKLGRGRSTIFSSITPLVVIYLLVILVFVVILSNTTLLHQLDHETSSSAASLANNGNHGTRQRQGLVSDLLEFSKGMEAESGAAAARASVHDGLSSSSSSLQPPEPHPPYGSCAILFFGLPRAFRQYVLPSIVRNVIIPNQQYGCDYYLHYYHIEQESSSRSGRGGSIHPDDVMLLPPAVEQIYDFFRYQQRRNGTTVAAESASAHRRGHRPHISITKDTNETFWKAREVQIMKYRTTKNADGNYTYFPYSEPTYVYPSTLDNIVKQWHSIDAVWNDMETYNNNRKNNKDGNLYRRVAMMRNDVIYITPIDIYQLPADPSPVTSSSGSSEEEHPDKSSSSSSESPPLPPKDVPIRRRRRGPLDYNNNHVVIPNWANYPINDRLIIGPYDAVRVWATERFSRIDDYALHHAPPGKGMHSETFLNESIVFPLIQQQLRYRLAQDDFICFLRVRADGAIWIEDCSTAKHVGSTGTARGFPDNPMDWLRPLLPQNVTCRKRRLRDDVRRVIELVCHEGTTSRIGSGGIGGKDGTVPHSRAKIGEIKQ